MYNTVFNFKNILFFNFLYTMLLCHKRCATFILLRSRTANPLIGGRLADWPPKASRNAATCWQSHGAGFLGYKWGLLTAWKKVNQSIVIIILTCLYIWRRKLQRNEKKKILFHRDNAPCQKFMKTMEMSWALICFPTPRILEKKSFLF